MEVIKIIKDSRLVEGKSTLTVTPDTDPGSIVHVNPIKMTERKDVNLGGWYVDLELHIEDKEHVDQDYIIIVDTKSKGEQPFRMHNKEVNKRRVKVRARHVLYDTELYVMKKLEVKDMSTAGVLERISKALDRSSPYKFISTHTTPISHEFEPMSLFEALTVLVNDKGAKLEADWYTIYLRDDLGNDRGVTISYGKDLEDIRGFEEWDHVTTKIYPIGDDDLELPEVYLESDVRYPREYTKVVKFSLDMGEKGEDQEWTEKEKQAKLRSLAKSYLTKHKYPKVAYQVTSNIKEDIDLWDTVLVKHPSLTYNLPLTGPITDEMKEKLGIPIRVLAYEYDMLSKRTTKLEYGDFSVRTDTIFKNKLDKIEKEIHENKNTLEERLKEQTDLINNWNKKGHMVILENEILFLDKLPMEKANHVLKIGLGGIAFSQTGVNGKFTSAWDLKGNFNTDFIGAGQIRTNHLASDVGSSLDISSNKSINLIAEKYDNMQIGGRNYILNSNDAQKMFTGYYGSTLTWSTEDMTQEWAEPKAKRMRSSGGTGILKALWTSSGRHRTTEPMHFNQEYTVSFYVKNNSNDVLSIYLNGLSGEYFIKPKESKRLVATGVRRKDYDWFQILLRAPDVNKNIDVTIAKVKFEKGNKATEWTPAPEEMAEKDKIVSYINVSPEKIKIKSSKIQLEGYTTINGGFHVDNSGNMIAKSGRIADWKIDSNIWSQNGSNYTTLKSGGDVAFATGSSSPYNTTGAPLQIWHNGKIVAENAELRGNLETWASGRLAIRLMNNRLRMYDWQGNRGVTGGLMVGKREGTAQDTISLYHEHDTILSLLYRNTAGGPLITYADFDKFNITGFESSYPIKMRTWMVVNGRIKARNGLVVNGSKNAVQGTEHYGERLINAYETAGYYFGDLGFGLINEEGECLIYIDDVFSEVINTEVKYHVFTQKYKGDIHEIERHPRYFIVKGEPGTEFSWELKAKRLGFEHHRLETPDAPLERGPEEEERNSELEQDLSRDLADILLNEEEE